MAMSVTSLKLILSDILHRQKHSKSDYEYEDLVRQEAEIRAEIKKAIYGRKPWTLT